jgi:hypothetical protein
VTERKPPSTEVRLCEAEGCTNLLDPTLRDGARYCGRDCSRRMSNLANSRRRAEAAGREYKPHPPHRRARIDEHGIPHCRHCDRIILRKTARHGASPAFCDDRCRNRLHNAEGRARKKARGPRGVLGYADEVRAAVEAPVDWHVTAAARKRLAQLPGLGSPWTADMVNGCRRDIVGILGLGFLELHDAGYPLEPDET